MQSTALAFILLILLTPLSETVISVAGYQTAASEPPGNCQALHGTWMVKTDVVAAILGIISNKEDKLNNKQLCNSNLDKCHEVLK